MTAVVVEFTLFLCRIMLIWVPHVAATDINRVMVQQNLTVNLIHDLKFTVDFKISFETIHARWTFMLAHHNMPGTI